MPYKGYPTNINETPGIKFYCACGESANKPYCDSSHLKTNSDKLPVEFVMKEARRVSICDCGKTGNPPFCDGSHSK